MSLRPVIMHCRYRCVLVALITIFLPPLCWSQDLSFRIVDPQGDPVADAVIELVLPNPNQTAPSPDDLSSATYVMDQVDKTFAPRQLIVPQGADVSFPNSDDIRHHVYSFSKAKPFELKLYKGRPKQPIRFGQHGVAVLGCNIHDSMVGYIYIASSAYVQASDAQGLIQFKDVPDNISTMTLWHANAQKGPETLQRIALDTLESAQQAYTVTLDLQTPPTRNTFENVFGNVR